MHELIRMIDDAILEARRWNAEGQATRSRELSVTITELETARLWAREAQAKADVAEKAKVPA